MEVIHALFLFLPMPRFAHLIFDLDGTVVDTQADLAAAVNYMLVSLGLPRMSVAQVRAYVGHGARVLVERALGASRAHLADRGFALFMDYYSAHLLDHTRAYQGITEFLIAARERGITLSVLTNKPEAPSRAILSGVRLTPLFAAVVGGDTLPVKKPNPQGVLYLGRVTGVAPAETLLIGDSSIDVETGRAAGIATCGVMWGYGGPGLVTVAPQFLVETPGQLSRLVLTEP